MPIFRFPFFYNPNYYNRFSNSKMYNFTENSISKHNQHKVDDLNSNKINTESNNHINNNSTSLKNDSNNSFNRHKKNNSINDNNTDENYFFELFGLKLYFDDILLISLIFFLYEEGVKDDELFLSLILLLLS